MQKISFADLYMTICWSSEWVLENLLCLAFILDGDSLLVASTCVYLLSVICWIPCVVLQTWGRRVLGVMSWTIPFFVACSTLGATNGTLFATGRYTCRTQTTWSHLDVTITVYHLMKPFHITLLFWNELMKVKVGLTSQILNDANLQHTLNLIKDYFAQVVLCPETILSWAIFMGT